MTKNTINNKNRGGSLQIAALTHLSDLVSGLLDLVYPPKCLVCDSMQPDYLCTECISQIQLIHPPICFLCGYPIPDGSCAECRRTEFTFDSAVSVAVYEGTLKDAIHKLKYSGHKVLGPYLGHLLVDYLHSRRKFISNIDCIVPLPIHSSRLAQRGFNQADLLAREVGQAFSLPVLMRAIERTTPTHPQVDLSIEDRRTNVVDAFSPVRGGDVDGRVVLLIDDVFTTGSTVDSAARALRKANAREVHVLTLARSL